MTTEPLKICRKRGNGKVGTKFLTVYVIWQINFHIVASYVLLFFLIFNYILVMFQERKYNFDCRFLSWTPCARLYARNIDIPVRASKWPWFLQGHVTANKLLPLLRRDLVFAPDPCLRGLVWFLSIQSPWASLFCVLTKVFIKIWGNSPCLFYMLTNTTWIALALGNGDC